MRRDSSSDPRRLLVSPVGVVHLPQCSAARRAAEINGWGEIHDVAAALARLRAGGMVPSTRSERRYMPGPPGREVCRRCLMPS